MIGVNFRKEGRLSVQEHVLTGRERVNLHLYMESSSRPSGCACYKTTGCQRYMLAFSVVAQLFPVCVLHACCHDPCPATLGSLYAALTLLEASCFVRKLILPQRPFYSLGTVKITSLGIHPLLSCNVQMHYPCQLVSFCGTHAVDIFHLMFLWIY